MAATWSQRYNNLSIRQHFDIPDRMSTTTSVNHAEIRDLSLDLQLAFNTPATIRYLYADTVTTSAPTIILPKNGGYSIITRLFLVDCGSPQLIIDCPSGPAAFTIYTLSFLPGTLLTIKTASEAQQVTPVLSEGEVGIQVIIGEDGKIVSLRYLTWVDDNEFKQDGQLHRLLRSQFAVATAWLCSDESATDAADILSFILKFTRSSRLAADIRLQALTLLAQSVVRGDAKANGLTYVPRLDFKAYDNVVDKNLSVADAYERQYDRFTDLEAGAEVWTDAATIMKDQYDDITEMCKTLSQQASDRYDSAQKAVQENNKLFLDADAEVEHARDILQDGYRQWLVEQRKEAILAVFKAVFDLGVAVAGCVFGQPEAAGAAVSAGKAAEEAYNAAEALVEAGSAVEKLVKGIKALPEVFEKMAKIAAAVSALLTSIDKAVAVANAPEPGEIDSPDSDMNANFIAALASWDIYLDELEVSMKFPIEQKIGGAEEYRLASRKMAILGKALLLSKMAAISQGQELARALMQLRVNKNQQERLDQWIVQLAQNGDAYAQAQVALFNRLLDVRGWIYIYLQSYVDSYRYWALAPSSVQPSMIERVAEYRKDYATLAIEVVQAYENFDPTPQGFRRVFNSGVDGSFLTEEVLAGLRDPNLKQASFTISTDNLPGYSRVRINTIRFYLKGVTGTDENPVRLEITNDGTYLDRAVPKNGMEPDVLSFCSDPLRRAFQYTTEDSEPVMDGDVAFPSMYFKPTPFTKWTIAVKSDIDPNSLSGVTMQLMGDAIAF